MDRNEYYTKYNDNADHVDEMVKSREVIEILQKLADKGYTANEVYIAMKILFR